MIFTLFKSSPEQSPTRSEQREIRAENHRLVAAVRAQRLALAHAFEDPIQPSQDCVAARERPSAEFLTQRQRAEQATGVRFSKFFAN